MLGDFVNLVVGCDLGVPDCHVFFTKLVWQQSTFAAKRPHDGAREGLRQDQSLGSTEQCLNQAYRRNVIVLLVARHASTYVSGHTCPFAEASEWFPNIRADATNHFLRRMRRDELWPGLTWECTFPAFQIRACVRPSACAFLCPNHTRRNRIIGCHLCSNRLLSGKFFQLQSLKHKNVCGSGEFEHGCVGDRVWL